MRILVAGGAGYVGSCCTEYLLDRGHDVVVLDSLVKGHRDAVDSRAEFVRASLADRAALDNVLGEARVDGIIHFAAFIEVAESVRDPGRYFANNVGAGIQLLDAAVHHRVPKIVFSSSAAVYGTPDTVPIPETARTQPINPYGESKLMFERILEWYLRSHGLSYVALRYFNAAGATARHGENHAPESHLIPLILQVAGGQRKTISIFGDDYDTPDGTCIRDFVHVLDLAAAHLAALQRDSNGCFNLGSGTGHSVRTVIETARRITGRPIAAVTAPPRPGDPARLVSDSSAAQRAFAWQPRHSDLDSIVHSAWAWHLHKLAT